MSHDTLTAGAPFPAITLDTADGSKIPLGQPQTGADWQMVVIYRGQHCPLCTRYINEIEKLKVQFLALGIDIVAASADSLAQLTSHREELAISYPIAYGLTLDQMAQLGLYVSHPRSAQETDHPFAEPGLFIINEQGQLQVIDISNSPFARPELSVLLSGLEFVRNPENHYPIRGTYKFTPVMTPAENSNEQPQ